jgi:DNA-binding response OmpR family regulator
MDKKNILVVDDEEDLRLLLRSNLEKEKFKVLEASDGIQALEKIQKFDIDCIVLDIMMPGKDGYEVCREIRKNGHTMPIIFLTAKDDEFDEVLGLEMGGDDYVKKPFSIKALISRIKSNLRRLEYNSTNSNKKIITTGNITINLNDYTVEIDNEEVFFPRKEFELLAYLAAHPNEVFSREHLLNTIWGEDTYVVDRTVDVHVGRIRKKLNNYKKRIKTVVGVGYKFLAE